MTLYTPTFNRPRRFHTNRPRLISPVYLVLAVGVVSAVLFSCTTTPVESNSWRSVTAMHYSDIAPSFRGNPGAASISVDASAAIASSNHRSPHNRQSPWKRTNDLKANSAARHGSADASRAQR